MLGLLLFALFLLLFLPRAHKQIHTIFPAFPWVMNIFAWPSLSQRNKAPATSHTGGLTRHATSLTADVYHHRGQKTALPASTQLILRSSRPLCWCGNSDQQNEGPEKQHFPYTTHLVDTSPAWGSLTSSVANTAFRNFPVKRKTRIQTLITLDGTEFWLKSYFF